MAKDSKKIMILDNVELLLDRIIVQKIAARDEVTETGFTVPADAREKNINLPKYGYVVAAGPGDPARGAMKCKVGDKVCFLFYSGTPLSIDDKQFMIMREFDVVFIIKEK